MNYVIKEQECGYLVKNGVYVKLLAPGKYNYFKKLGYEVLVVPMLGQVKTCGIPVMVLMKDPEFAKRTLQVEIPDECIALHFVNKAFCDVVTVREVLYWNVYETNECRLVDIINTEMESAIPRMYLELMPVKLYKKITIKDGETGLLYFDQTLQKRLGQGTYYYWNYGREVSCKIFNMKIQQMEISGQEILTADKVGIRLNVNCSYRISDPEKMVGLLEGANTQLYTCVQMLLREYIGRFRLDELLAQKEEIGQFILGRMKESQEDYCVEVISAGIKDVILPGEIRDIMNTVLIAEKKAQANVIMRREEVASTRSLLNTARLMEENKTLFKLKEMEYLEKICDKVGNISLNGGKGILEQLSELTGGGR